MGGWVGVGRGGAGVCCAMRVVLPPPPLRLLMRPDPHWRPPLAPPTGAPHCTPSAGVRRAFPYVPPEQVEPLIEAHAGGWVRAWFFWVGAWAWGVCAVRDRGPCRWVGVRMGCVRERPPSHPICTLTNHAPAPSPAPLPSPVPPHPPDALFRLALTPPLPRPHSPPPCPPSTQSDALFRLAHSGGFGVGTQALLLLFQLMSARSAASDRFYR